MELYDCFIGLLNHLVTLALEPNCHEFNVLYFLINEAEGSTLRELDHWSQEAAVDFVS